MKKNKRHLACSCLHYWRCQKGNCSCVDDEPTPPVPPVPPTPEEYQITIDTNDIDFWDVDVHFIDEIEEWTAISTNANVLTIWEATITATAEDWYKFTSWKLEDDSDLPATVTEDLSIVANFELDA